MKLTIPERTNPNCYVFQMGYQYPVMIQYRHQRDQALNQLTPVFGTPSQEYYFLSPNRVRWCYQDQQSQILSRRWYVGQRLWRRVKDPRSDFWMVFRTERDRTLALMMLS